MKELQRVTILISLLAIGSLPVQGLGLGRAVPQCPPGEDVNLPNPDDCGSFYLCDNGKPWLQMCPPNLHYDPITDACLYPNEAHCEVVTSTSEAPTKPSSPDTTTSTTTTTTSTTPSPPDTTSQEPMTCSGTPTKPIPNPNDCSTFFVCDNGHLVLLSCPVGLHFNPIYLVCDTPENAHCDVEETRLEESECHEDGELLPNPDDCSTFFLCSGGIPVLMVCPPDLYYNEEMQYCDEPQNSPCFTGTTGNPQTTVSTTEWATDTTTEATTTEMTTPPTGNPETTSTEWATETDTTTTEATTTTDSTPSTSSTPGYEPDCPPSGTTVLPNPFDCGSFFVCIEGSGALIECPDGYEFNVDVGSCTKEAGKCHISTTETTDSWSTISTETSWASTDTTWTATDQTTETTKDPDTTAGPPDCPPDQTGEVLFPNPEDCGSYYVCDNGKPVLLPCPPGLHFDPLLHVCRDPAQAHCEATRNRRH